MLTRDRPRESHRALAWSAEAMASTFCKVNAPDLSVMPYQKISARGMRVKPTIQNR